MLFFFPLVNIMKLNNQIRTYVPGDFDAFSSTLVLKYIFNYCDVIRSQFLGVCRLLTDTTGWWWFGVGRMLLRIPEAVLSLLKCSYTIDKADCSNPAISLMLAQCPHLTQKIISVFSSLILHAAPICNAAAQRGQDQRRKQRGEARIMASLSRFCLNCQAAKPSLLRWVNGVRA